MPRVAERISSQNPTPLDSHLSQTPRYLSFSFQVSWIRVRDLGILSIGKIRYTTDDRFAPLHEEGNDVWALKIMDVRRADAGKYECQVSYHDDVEKKMKKPVALVVLGITQHIIGFESVSWNRWRNQH